MVTTSSSPEVRYRRLARALGRQALPAAVVDLDALEANVDTLLAPVAAANAKLPPKTLRVASKSIRCVRLLERIAERGGPLIRGTMCYAVAEAQHLYARGFDDLLVAYPTLAVEDLDALARLTRVGAKVSVVVDGPEQVLALAPRAQREGVEVKVIIEVDASWRPAAGIHLGVRRSPLFDPDAAVRLAELVRDTAGTELGGIMLYEAQIAGLGDANPFSPLINPAKAALRRASRGPVARRRASVRQALEAAGFSIDLVNGGGSGSLAWAAEEAALTELTAGSGFVASHLFDYYRDLRLEPALAFAVQIVRRPGPGLVTCHGGGYIASGETGPDRLPLPWLPEGLALLGLEGAGEVQTPLRVPQGLELGLGAPVFFRHAKAGELAEHFNHYHLVRGEEIVETVPTYRGEGQAFL